MYKEIIFYVVLSILGSLVINYATGKNVFSYVGKKMSVIKLTDGKDLDNVINSSDIEKKEIQKSDKAIDSNNVEYQQSCLSQQDAFRFAKEVQSQYTQIKAIYIPYYDDLQETNIGYRCTSENNRLYCHSMISELRKMFESNFCRSIIGTQNCFVIEFQRGVILSDLIHYEGSQGGDTPQDIFAAINENKFPIYEQHIRCWRNRLQQSQSVSSEH